MEHIDLAAYFRRIGFDAAARPDFETLATLHRLHSRSIPFESLNPWLGLPVLLDPASLQRKLVEGRRGGYCFEHNLLLADVLTQLGFQVTRLAARVLWNLPPDTVRPRTHMLLAIDLDGERLLLDGGFGGMTLTGPLRLNQAGPQATPHERFQLLKLDGDVLMQAEVAGEWRPLYRFDLQPQQQVDYELVSWYLCNHPDSHFRQRLIAARTRADGRDTLADNEFTRHYLDGRSEKQVITSAEELRATLEQVFGLQLPEVPHLQQRLQDVVRPKAA
ncbi:arylamine N-acetyltransferase family protein [Ideonella sp. BN130291]|uniref:arylamine N-acetyltransferase family protein n=1 Tax=Ideonella sp. BN130291 TaxID=3112940 RepID=UPI002E258854|nr:arylamine N-acetyltransferase [Ideonella sp. BN130291]